HEDERLRIRLNGNSGVKLSIQKQPTSNTVEVVDAVKERLQWLQQQKLLPADITIEKVGDQSTYVRQALNNATTAVLSGALLAMLVVYLFLGNLPRTLIIGTAIPLAIFVTFILMSFGGLTLNIMTLGGLALGVGMLVDNTIVMLENITRHQRLGENDHDAPINAAREVNSAIIASTSTNLAAILPFLFFGGLTGLLFNELIITLSASILASLIIALTVVPALAARVRNLDIENTLQRNMNHFMQGLQARYARLLDKVLLRPWLPILVLLPLLLFSARYLIESKQIFLPPMDEGQISINVQGDTGIQFDDLDLTITKLEHLFQAQADVESVYTQSGGSVFGRSTYESSNSGGMNVQLRPLAQRQLNSQEWITHMQKEVDKLQLVGYRINMRVRGVRGLHVGSGDDDVSIRIQGDDLDKLAVLGDEVISRLRDMKTIRNLEHNYEQTQAELLIDLDRERAAKLGITAQDIGDAVQVALDGRIVSEYLEGDRQYNIRLRLPPSATKNPEQLGNTLVGFYQQRPVYLNEVAKTRLSLAPASIKRDNQRRIVEISASLAEGSGIEAVMDEVYQRLNDLPLPDGYTLYDGGVNQALQEGRNMGYILLTLALFLVFVVMAVQYESLRNPLIIMLGVPFAVIGVVGGLIGFDIPVSMPVWLGLIMLVGIVVNNAIILVEQIELQRRIDSSISAAILNAARLRLRPILMTALTTIIGMLPLALGWGEGAEMLKPLALVIVSGLSFSTLISLIVIPSIYQLFTRKT
ncbi:MAG: efflux RND transporter permease subunit, partial [Gammaproteobacteria bacterium]|nr:efflux RND transporter permease subunit [Gammaproteobacteria bacterium]